MTSAVGGERRATLAGVAAIGLWSTLAVLTVATGDIPPLQLLAMTFAIGGVAGIAALRIRPDMGLRTLRQPPKAFALTVSALFGYHALYFLALKTAPAVEANLVNYLWPLLIVVFAGWLAGQHVHAKQYVGTIMGLAGAALIVTRGERLGIDAEYVGGYLAALCAALIWASYSVLNRRFAAIEPAAIAGPCLAVAALAALAHGLFETTVAPDPKQWLAIALMGLGPVGAAFLFWDLGTKRGDIALLGTLAYGAPLFSTLWLLIAGQARPHWTQWVACLLIVAGSLLSVRSAHARRSTATGGTSLS